MRNFYFIISLVFFSLPLFGLGQNSSNADSLKKSAEWLITQSLETASNPTLRMSIADSALKQATLSGDKLIIARSLLTYGQACYMVNRYNNAIDSAKKALTYFLNHNDTVNQIKAYNFLGACNLRMARYETAIDFIDKTIFLSKKLNDSLMLASSYNNLGIVYFNTERYTEAEEYFKQSIAFYENLGSFRQIARVQGNLGLNYLNIGNFDEAIKWFDTSLKIRLELKDTLMLASIYDNIGNTHEKLNHFEKSLEYYNLSKQYFAQQKSRHGIAVSSVAIGRVQLELGNFSDAIRNITAGQAIALADHEDEIVMQSYKLISDYYLKTKKFEQSRQALAEYVKYFEKLFNEKTTSRLAELRVQLETARNEQDNQLLKTQLEFQELNAKQSNRLKTIYSISAVLLLMLLSITLYFIYQLRNRNKEIKRINKKLILFNDQLEKLVKERTKDLSEALERVQEVEKIKSAFLSNISHEVRTPLNGILGFTQYLISPNVPDDEKLQYGKMTLKLGNKLLSVVEDILELSKIETNQLELHYADFNINELLADLYFSYSNNEDFLEKNLNFRFVKSIPDNQAIFSIDVYRVKKIMAHLIENAFKFTNTGSIEFGYIADSPSTIKFFVKDTGIGIPKKVQTRIFERFYKHVADDHVAFYDGTGVGLTIAKGFAIAMGGRIEIESTPNHGSTFYLYIPKKTPELSLSSQIFDSKLSWENKTVLVVEDDLISYQYIEALMQRTGARLIHVKNAEDAIEVTSINKELNLVLLDIQLPFMSGIDAARIIRRSNKRIPIIAQTANTVNDDGKLCVDAGCNAFIAKPIDPDELFALINSCII